MRRPCHGRTPHPRRVAHPRRPLGGHRPAAPRTQKHPPLRRRPPPQVRPGLPGGHPLRLTHRLPVEGAGRHPLLPRLDGPRPLPGVGAGRRLFDPVGARPDGLRRLEGDRLGLAEYGRLHDQGAPRGGKRRAKTPPTGPRRARSAACWSRPRASRWAWRWRAPTGRT